MMPSAPISIDMCLAGRDLTEPRQRPDGGAVAVVVRWAGRTTIVTVSADGGPERMLTTAPEPAPGRGFLGGCFAWTPDGSAIVYAGRDGNLWHQPESGLPPNRLTEVGEASAFAAPVVSPDGRSVAAVLDLAEVWEIPIGGGAPERLDDGSADFVIDPSPMPPDHADGWIWQAWDVPNMAWDRSYAQFATRAEGGFERGVYRPAHAIQQLRHHPDGRGLSVRDDTGWLNVWLGDEPLVDEAFEHAEPTWGPGQRSFAVSPDGRRVAFTRNERGFGRLCVVDVGTRAVSEVGRGVHGSLQWVGDRLTAVRSGARTPTQVVAYDTSTWERSVIAVGPVLGWDSAALPEPDLVEVEHDGVTLHARRYVAGEGRTLCWVHGGPTGQWPVEFMPRVAYWWSRGWDVLVPDPRGTTGHGRRYQQSLQGGWGRLDVDDTAAILAASHSGDRSEPSRTVMIGSSSGGMTALGVLGLHPGLAAGGVALYPVTDATVLAAKSHRFEAHYTIGLIGPLDDTELYALRSPMSYADRIGVPLLVMHGDDDPVVPLSSTLEFVERVEAAGGDVELHVMEGEGHGFRDPTNQRTDYELTGRFLDRVVPSP